MADEAREVKLAREKWGLGDNKCSWQIFSTLSLSLVDPNDWSTQVNFQGHIFKTTQSMDCFTEYTNQFVLVFRMQWFINRINLTF